MKREPGVVDLRCFQGITGQRGDFGRDWSPKIGKFEKKTYSFTSLADSLRSKRGLRFRDFTRSWAAVREENISSDFMSNPIPSRRFHRLD